MNLGIVICFVGAAFGIWQYLQTKALPVQASLALSPILDLATELDDDPKVKQFAEFLDPPKDHIRITSRLLNEGVLGRFEVEESILAAFGKLVHAEMTKPKR